MVFGGRRQRAWPLQRRAELLRHGDGSMIDGIDRMNDLAPAKVLERPIHRCRRAFGGVTLAPGFAHQAPADLMPRPTLGLPRTEPADPASAGTLDHREHAEAVDAPAA